MCITFYQKSEIEVALLYTTGLHKLEHFKWRGSGAGLCTCHKVRKNHVGNLLPYLLNLEVSKNKPVQRNAASIRQKHTG